MRAVVAFSVDNELHQLLRGLARRRRCSPPSLARELFTGALRAALAAAAVGDGAKRTPLAEAKHRRRARLARDAGTSLKGESTDVVVREKD